MSKKSTATAIITAIALGVTGYFSGNGTLAKLYNKIVSINSKSDDATKTASPIVDSTNEYRNDIMKEVYSFVDDMNSTKVLISNGKKVMFDFDEGMALYLYANANQLSSIDLCNLFGDSKVNYIDIRTAHESATSKLTFYYANSKYISSLATLIGEDKDNDFLSKFEELQIKYNQATSKQERAAIARSIYDAINANFGAQIDAPYTHINQGVSRLILDCMVMSNEVGVVGFSDKAKDDLNGISLSLCQTTNEMVKELINNFNDILTQRDLQQLDANANDNIQDNDENSYESLRSEFIGKLTADGHYPSEGFSFSSDINSNYSEPQKTASTKVKSKASSKVSTKTGTIVGNKKVVDSGKKLTEKQLDEVIKDLPAEAKKQAEDEKQKIKDDIAKKNIEGEESGAGLAQGYDDHYDSCFNAGYNGEDKPPYMTAANLPAAVRDRSTSYQANYIKGCNRAVDAGYADGSIARKQRMARDKAPDVIVPNANSNTNSNPSTIPQGQPPFTPAQSNNNGSNVDTPNGNSTVQLKPEYEDKVDGPITDEHGNVIGYVKPTSFNSNELNQLRQLRMAYVNAVVTAQVKAYYRDKANEDTVKVYRQA